jgi:hemolysin activation/secretion protein
LIGDRAWAVRLEPSFIGRTGAGWMRTYQLYAFYDGGEVVQEDAPAGADPSRSLASAGFGARLSLMSYFEATLEAAWPLTRPVASYQISGEGKEARILGSLVARF